MMIRKACPECGAHKNEQSREDVGTTRIITLECGHCLSEDIIPEDDGRIRKWVFPHYFKLKEENPENHVLGCPCGCRPYPYQYDGIEFAMKANFRCGIFDEQGVGKTIQATGVLALFGQEKLFPALIVCKSANTIQWLVELLKKAGKDFKAQWIKNNGMEPKPEYFDIFICSYDILRGADWLETLEVKTIILDECQAIKNRASKRYQAVAKLCEGKEHIIALSGTPFLNNMKEYFPILNILDPVFFWSEQNYLDNFVEKVPTAYSYKYGGLRKDTMEMFKNRVSQFVIRRTRDEVLPDLPKVRRNTLFATMDEMQERAMNKEMRGYMEAYERWEEAGKSFASMTDILTYIQKMWGIAGEAKVPFVVDRVEEHLRNTDRPITVFAHHVGVREMLMQQINSVIDDINKEKAEKGEELLGKCILYAPETGSSVRQRQIENSTNFWWFEENYKKHRVAVVSLLAGGEGINLQRCSEAIMAERYFNPGKEEQPETRFTRPGSTAEYVGIDYATLVNSIDEWFASLVSDKRKYTKSGLEYQHVEWNEDSLMMQLAEKIYQMGSKKFRLPAA